MLQVDLQPLTFRELLEMYRGHLEEKWQHTSALMVMMANVHGGSKLPTNYFNPFKKAAVSESLTANDLRLIFKNKKRER